MPVNSADVVYHDLKKDIIQNKYKPGQKVVEDKLAKIHGTSRTPVREALRRLEQEDLIESIPNVGSFVRKISLAEVTHYFDARGAMEGLAARLVAQKPDPAFIKELRTMDEKILLSHEAKNLEASNRADAAFHKRIAQASKNTYIMRWLDLLEHKLLWFLNISNVSRIEYLDGIPIKDMKFSHPMIIKAIESGDVEEAERMARSHVEDSKQYFINFCYYNLMQ